MIRKIMKSKIFRIINTPLLLFYKKKYLSGYYFDVKVMGWVWAWKAVPFKLLGINNNLPFPADSSVRIHDADNIIFDRNDIHIFQSPGLYINNFSEKVYIGPGTYIAPNVGIITANHDLNNPSIHMKGKSVRIGENCWIGMNSVILPGVELGDNTVVGAGSIVTKSFPKGKCVIAGNPAKIIKEI